MSDVNRPTNKELARLLKRLGFVPHAEIHEKAKLAWRHPNAGTILVLPSNRSLEPALYADLIYVRNQLHYNGLLDQADFDSFVKSGRQVLEASS